jgi:hypothetical protein
MRVTSLGLSEHITSRRDGIALSSIAIAIAADAFAAAAFAERRRRSGALAISPGSGVQ